MMLAPLRDHLSPRDPTSFPLLHATRDRYFSRLSVDVDPGNPGFDGAGWITSEDVNIEHLLDVFTSVEDSVEVWDACACFMNHLYWHKKRLIVLRPKIEGLPDDHRSKPQCLFWLARLFESVGNIVEGKRLLVHTLGLWRERGDSFQVAGTLRFLSDANRMLGLREEGIEGVKEALEIFKKLDIVLGQAVSWQQLALLLYSNKQLDAAEEAASQSIDLFSNNGNQHSVSQCYRLLGDICGSRGETEKAVKHYGAAIGIASSLNAHDLLFWNNYSLALLFLSEKRLGDAHTHVERTKSYAINDPYNLVLAMEIEARVWNEEGRFEEAKSGVLRAIDAFEKLGAAEDVERCRRILRFWFIEKAVRMPAASLG